MHVRLLFLILFVASNLMMLPFYYHSEKQDFRGLVNYLKGHLRHGDKIILGTESYFPGVLHYFGVYPDGWFYLLSTRRVPEDEIEYRVCLIMGDKQFIISNSKKYWINYAMEGNRLWIVVDENNIKELRKISALALKGYFDGSVLNFDRFPRDASMYLFLWDPQSPNGKQLIQ